MHSQNGTLRSQHTNNIHRTVYKSRYSAALLEDSSLTSHSSEYHYNDASSQLSSLKTVFDSEGVPPKSFSSIIMAEEAVPSLSSGTESSSSSNESASFTPMIIGLYGISGAGKSFLMNHIKSAPELKDFMFYEGSAMISQCVPHGGLAAFSQMADSEKEIVRRHAIQQIKTEAFNAQKHAVITGHFSFWQGDKCDFVYTTSDLETYTHIFYLCTPPEVVHERRRKDVRERAELSCEALQEWQQAELSKARDLCYAHSILLHIIPGEAPDRSKLVNLLRDLEVNFTGESNKAVVQERVCSIVKNMPERVKSALVFDGDKTLIAENTGALF